MTSTVLPVNYQNPDATMALTLPLEVIENTPIEDINSNIIKNSAMYENWLQVKDEHDIPAILIAGGASINDHVDDIKELQNKGAIVFAMNAASKWALENGIFVDYQVILDAKEETSSLVDPYAKEHYFSSQCHPETLRWAKGLTIWHLSRLGVEDLFPPERVNQGGYVIVGGNSSVGVCGLCLAYTQGYRNIHMFGFDTSHKEGSSHGYEQRMNDTMPTYTTPWHGKDYQVSIALKEQPTFLMLYTNELTSLGCDIDVYGEGLFQAIYNTDVNDLSEKDKYRLMWMFDEYRVNSPGGINAAVYIEMFKPEGKVIDFGCGSGSASIIFKESGLEPILVDFADNCRNEEALCLPFLIADLTEEIPIQEKYGFCADVMEHIPTKDVGSVIKNIMDSVEQCYFQISTVDDIFGQMFGLTLHLTIKPHEWWCKKFLELGLIIEFDDDMGSGSVFYITRSK